ncbi:MAG: hypothetical protein ACI4IS_00285 [Acutalibacteraceae bacterium]
MEKEKIKENKKKGFVAMYRSMLDWEYADDNTVFACFVKLLLVVNHQNKKWQGQTIEKGSIVCSIDSLSHLIKIKCTSLKRCLKLLNDCGAIVVETAPNKFHKITIPNYTSYQNVVSRNSTDRATNKATNKPTNTPTDRATNKPTTTKQYKQYNNGNNVSLAPQGRSDTEKEIEKAVPSLPASPLSGEPPKPAERTVSYIEVERYSRQKEKQDDCYDDWAADSFHTAFERSGTQFPENWKQLYDRFVHLSDDEQQKALDRIKSGEFKELWNR